MIDFGDVLRTFADAVRAQAIYKKALDSSRHYSFCGSEERMAAQAEQKAEKMLGEYIDQRIEERLKNLEIGIKSETEAKDDDWRDDPMQNPWADI